VALACVWVHWNANDADAVLANNRDAARGASRAAMRRAESERNSRYTPRR
jgi:formaldehyde-activating enzyme involved in methanogenesis